MAIPLIVVYICYDYNFFSATNCIVFRSVYLYPHESFHMYIHIYIVKRVMKVVIFLKFLSNVSFNFLKSKSKHFV